MFAKEKDCDGKRGYIVATLPYFWHKYTRSGITFILLQFLAIFKKMHKWVDPGFFSRHSGTINKWPSWCLHWQKEGLLLETAMLNYHSQGIRQTFFNPVSCFSPTQTNCWVFLYRCKKSAGHLRGMGCTSPASLPWISPLQGMVYLKLLAVQKLGGKGRWSWPKKSSTDLYTDPKFKMTK